MTRSRPRSRLTPLTRTLAAAISLALIQQTAAQGAGAGGMSGGSSGPGYGLDANGLTMDPQRANRQERRTVSTIPFQYTGSNARISFGVDDDMQVTGEGLGIFGFDGTKATLLEGRLGRHGAGGVKLGYHWLWGDATREDTLGEARDVWVAKVFGAVDRNEFHDRKATIGGGIERNNLFLDLYYEHALSDPRRTSSTSDSVTDTITGADPDGRPWQQDITTTTRVEQFAVPYAHGVGFRVGRYFEYPMVRLRGGLDYAWGDELLQDDRAHQMGATISAEKFIEDTGHSLALELGYTWKNAPFDNGRFGQEDEDIRVALQWRYEFGQAHRRTDSEAPEAASDRPAPWVERALRNLPAHRRQVDTYAAQRTTVTTLEGEKVYLNRAPVAGDAESFAVVSGTALTGNVLSNDSDPDPGDTLTAVLTQNVAHGTLVLNADGSFTYTPTAGYTGPDSFTYVVRDQDGADSAPVTVTLTVEAANQAPVAQNDAFTTPFGTVLSRLDGGAALLSNDTDPDGDPLTVVNLVSDVAHGTLFIASDGGFTYTPDANFSGTDTFTYTVEDTAGVVSNVATVTITVDPPVTGNVAPVANADSVQAVIGGPIDLFVLGNDTDANSGDVLSIASHTQPASGTLQLAGDHFTYTPTEAGTFTFTYIATDGQANSQPATVTITVSPTGTNLAPVAGPAETFTAVAGVALTGDVLDAQDTDPNPGDSLHVELTANVAHGTLQLNADGTFTYTADAAFTGPTDSFTYVVEDQLGAQSAPVTVVITVAPAGTNLPPVAGAPEFYRTNINIGIFGLLLANDSDPNPGDTLTAVLLTDVTHGDLDFNADGFLNYYPTTDYQGQDTFTYVVEDDKGARSAEVTVRIEIGPLDNLPPIANLDRATTPSNTPVEVNFLANDTDEDKSKLTLVYFNTLMGVEEVTEVSPGVARITPQPNFVGELRTGYYIADELGQISTPQGMILVDVRNQAPVAAGDGPLPVPFETAVQIPTASLLDNDSDPESQVITFGSVSDPVNGTLVDTGSGVLTYTPDAGHSGQDSFTYTIVDSFGVPSAPATVNLDVRTTSTPMAIDDVLVKPHLPAVGGNVLNNDHGRDPLQVELTQQGANGTVTLSSNGDFTYVLNTRHFIGQDTFRYRVRDVDGLLSNEATVTLTIVNSTPIAVADTARTFINTPIRIPLTDNDSDADGENVEIDTASQFASVQGGVVKRDPSFAAKYVDYTPPPGFTGTDFFLYDVRDIHGARSGAVRVDITVDPAP